MKALPAKQARACLLATRNKKNELGKLFNHAPFDLINGISKEKWNENKNFIQRINQYFIIHADDFCEQNINLSAMIENYYLLDGSFSWSEVLKEVRAGADPTIDSLAKVFYEQMKMRKTPRIEAIAELLSYGFQVELNKKHKGEFSFYDLACNYQRLDYAFLFLQYQTTDYARYSEDLMAAFSELMFVQSTGKFAAAKRAEYIPKYLSYIDCFKKGYRYNFREIVEWLFQADVSEVTDKIVANLLPYKDNLFAVFKQLSEADQLSKPKLVLEGKNNTAIEKVLWAGKKDTSIDKGRMGEFNRWYQGVLKAKEGKPEHESLFVKERKRTLLDGIVRKLGVTREPEADQDGSALNMHNKL